MRPAPSCHCCTSCPRCGDKLFRQSGRRIADDYDRRYRLLIGWSPTRTNGVIASFGRIEQIQGVRQTLTCSDCGYNSAALPCCRSVSPMHRSTLAFARHALYVSPVASHRRRKCADCHRFSDWAIVRWLHGAAATLIQIRHSFLIGIVIVEHSARNKQETCCDRSDGT